MEALELGSTVDVGGSNGVDGGEGGRKNATNGRSETEESEGGLNEIVVVGGLQTGSVRKRKSNIQDGFSSTGTTEGEEDIIRCKRFLVTKRRLCRMLATGDSKYCAEHMGDFASDSGRPGEDRRIRVPCPLNPKHTVFKHLVDKHVLKCNDRPQPLPVYHLENVNLNREGNVETPAMTLARGLASIKVPLGLINDTQYFHCIKEIVKFHGERKLGSVPEHKMHHMISPQLVRSDIGQDKVRHYVQVSSILKHMDDNDLIKDSTCFIEFGSGRGALSYYLAKLVLERNLKDCSFILVDCTSPRHKHDNKLKDSGLDIDRIRINIKDLLLSELTQVRADSTKRVVGMAKHLCGSGTDLAINALFNDKNSESKKVAGAIFATCCHHKCEWHLFSGRNFLENRFLPAEFSILSQMATWQTDGGTLEKTLFEPQRNFRAAGSLEKELKEKLLSSEQFIFKKVIAASIKDIFNFARSKFIESCSDMRLKCKMITYCDNQTTLENTAIVVSKRTI